MTPTDIASVVVAGCLSLSQLVTQLKPVWGKLPKAVALLCPVALVVLPQVADAAGYVKTEVDLAHFVVYALGVTVPAVIAALTGKQLPPAPPSDQA